MRKQIPKLVRLFPQLARWKTAGFDKFPPEFLPSTISGSTIPLVVPDDLARWTIVPSQEELHKRGGRAYKLLDDLKSELRGKTAKDREKALHKFAEEIEPSRKGGRSFSPESAAALKQYNEALKACIRLVRKSMKDAAEFNLEDLKEVEPGLDSIFTDEEITAIFHTSSVAATARKIILARLKQTDEHHENLTYLITERSLRNILSKS